MGKNNIGMQRIEYIDILKGIAMLSVIVGHYFNNGIIGTLIWSFHMPLFVIISGYFFQQKNIKDIFKQNAKSYLCPYLLTAGGATDM